VSFLSTETVRLIRVDLARLAEERDRLIRAITALEALLPDDEAPEARKRVGNEPASNRDTGRDMEPHKTLQRLDLRRDTKGDEPETNAQPDGDGHRTEAQLDAEHFAQRRLERRAKERRAQDRWETTDDSQTAIAGAAGCTVQTLQSWARKFQWKARPNTAPGSRSPVTDFETIDRARVLWQIGGPDLAYTTIAEDVGCTVATLKAWAARFGWGEQGCRHAPVETDEPEPAAAESSEGPDTPRSSVSLSDYGSADRLKIDMPFEDAVKHAVSLPKPPPVRYTGAMANAANAKRSRELIANLPGQKRRCPDCQQLTTSDPCNHCGAVMFAKEALA
jgi:hypothetical protein